MMKTLRFIKQVDQDGFLHIQVPPDMGKVFDVVIVSVDAEQDNNGLNYTNLQEHGGFVKEALGSADEDIWISISDSKEQNQIITKGLAGTRIFPNQHNEQRRNTMNAVREIVTRQTLKQYKVPEELGEHFEMILLPLNGAKTENERFLAATYAHTIEDDVEEDAVWGKYL